MLINVVINFTKALPKQLQQKEAKEERKKERKYKKLGLLIYDVAVKWLLSGGR